MWFGWLWAMFPPVFRISPWGRLFDGPVHSGRLSHSRLIGLRQPGERQRMHGYRWFNRKVTRRIAPVLAVTLAVESASCGTVIHPGAHVAEPHSGALDPSIVVLDGLGVLVFWVPGVVAFIVDFSTGAIWLPDQHFSPYVPLPVPPPGAYPPYRWPEYPPGAVPGRLPAPEQPAATAHVARTPRGLSCLITATHADRYPWRKTDERADRSHHPRRHGTDDQVGRAEVRAIRANNLEDASATLRNVESAPNAESPAPPK